jgi:hypothetical protein
VSRVAVRCDARCGRLLAAAVESEGGTVRVERVRRSRGRAVLAGSYDNVTYMTTQLVTARAPADMPASLDVWCRSHGAGELHTRDLLAALDAAVRTGTPRTLRVRCAR